MRRKVKSIELPDLDPTPRRAQPIPIGPLNSGLGRTDSNAERLVGGIYGRHIPAEVAQRNHTTPDPRRDRPRTRVDDDTRMASLMAELEQSRTPQQNSTPDPNQTYRAPSAIEQRQQQQQGEIVHSKLRFGFERNALVNAGIIPRSTTAEDASAAVADPNLPLDVTVISPSEVASGLVSPAATTLDSGAPSVHAFTPVEIKWTGDAGDVILSLYSAVVGGFGITDIIKADNHDDGHGLYRMERVECVNPVIANSTLIEQCSDQVFTKLLNFGPGTHHMRFFVSNAPQSTPESPLPAESYEGLLSTTLPTSPDPSGTLANYVVVAPLKTPGIGTGKLEVGEGGGAAVKPLPTSPDGERDAVLEDHVSTAPMTQLGHNLVRGSEPGQSFWSKGSEDHDSDPSDHEPEDAEVHREGDIDGQRKARGRKKTCWTSEIPLELFEAAEEEAKYLESQKVHPDDEPR